MNTKGTMLITGATGLLASHLAVCALKDGVRVICLARPKDGVSAQERVESALEFALQDPRFPALNFDNLSVVEGNVTTGRFGLSSSQWDVLTQSVDCVFHCAASTEFKESTPGESRKCNVGSTINVLEFLRESGATLLHISTAYVAGGISGTAREDMLDYDQKFNNIYEITKHEAEALVRKVCEAEGIPYVIFRPSIVIGDSKTGRTFRFNNIYELLRVLHLVGQAMQREKEDISLRIETISTATKNLIPLDYAVQAIWQISRNPEAIGRTFHITNPNPPTIADLRDVFAEIFDLPGLKLISPGTLPLDEANDMELTIARALDAYQPYLVSEPLFDRANTDRFLAEKKLAFPVLDVVFFRRLVDFAVEVNWGKIGMPDGKRVARTVPANRFVRDYFEEFLPQKMHQELVRDLHGLSVTCRIELLNDQDNHWIMVIDRGKLVGISRNGIHVQCTFEVDRKTFEEVVSGRLAPQEAFFDKRIEIRGDVEMGLKLATVLEQFFSEHPFRA